MRVKIFNHQHSFKGVLYNIAKVSSDRAELMCTENFHALGLLRVIKPQDYIDYLMSISAAGKSQKPQFHSAISCQEESINKWALTAIAKQWMEKMGFGKQPYLIFFHYDTSINHVHLVSTRVNREGRQVENNFYEGIRAYKCLNEILGIDPQKQAHEALNNALGYKFANRMEFIMLLYALGYRSEIKNGALKLIRYGRVQAEIPLEKIYERIAPTAPAATRVDELKAIFARNLSKYDTSIQIIEFLKYQNFSSYPIKCKSEFIEQLKKQYNMQLIFHGRSRQLPTHYCIIDHQSKAVLEGNSIYPIAEFIRPVNRTLLAEDLSPDTAISAKEDIAAYQKESKSFSISDFNIDISEDTDAPAINKKRKNKQNTVL